MQTYTSIFDGLIYETQIIHSLQGYRAYTLVWDYDSNLTDETEDIQYIDYAPAEIHVQELEKLKVNPTPEWYEKYWSTFAEEIAEYYDED